jgi:orotate phosphoribosyltransferase
MHSIKQAILKANVIKEGHFVFADGDHALLKLEMDNLWDHDKELTLVLDTLGEAQGLPRADVILGVPTGGQRIAIELVRSGRLDAALAMLERVPGGAKQDFKFATPRDEKLAREARSVRIYEDVVSTLSSIAGVVKLLDSSQQNIHSLAIWRRGKVKPEYRQGVTDNYLIEEIIPSFSVEECPYPGCQV